MITIEVDRSMKYKVLIPSAGLGTRLGDFSKNLNKALISVDNKPVISHVIEKFDIGVEFVIAIGHKGEVLKDYINMAHPERKVTFVEIDNYQGSGSGLGLTILKCKEHLQCPFVFCPNDTIILEDVPTPDTNWMGVSPVENNKNYRSIAYDDDLKISKIYEKKDILSTEGVPYIGLAGIKDYQEFWTAMTEGKNFGSIKVGEAFAFRKFLKKGKPIKAKVFTWFDTGNQESLNYARLKLKSADAPEILEKQDESIWMVNGKVIKYNIDKNFIRNRVSRAKNLSGFVPFIESSSNNLYSYRKITGQVFSRDNSDINFSNLLRFLELFWARPALDQGQHRDFKQRCLEFYKKKTKKRVSLYHNMFRKQDTYETINGNIVPPISELLNLVDWDNLSSGIPTRFHGDLHFENILISETGNFSLLDWRQDFAGLQEYGDLYYDLAKLLHGMIMSHEIVNKNLFNITEVDDVIEFDFNRKHMLIENEKAFYEYLKRNNLDATKVNILTALIFLNIAPLHHYPYSKLLYYLGKSMLYKELVIKYEK